MAVLSTAIETVEKRQQWLVDRGVTELLEGLAAGSGRTPEEELRQQAAEFKRLTDSLRKDPLGKPRGQAWDAMREFLERGVAPPAPCKASHQAKPPASSSRSRNPYLRH
jgi:hypothetical protein